MSYSHFDDQHNHGELTKFRERLSSEVQAQTGEEFPIFQDRNDIYWGQNWEERIDGSLDQVTFFIPIITPSFFTSEYCRKELKRFVEREKKLGQKDLILPVYYINCPLLEEGDKRQKDELAQAIAAHQYADWRNLRFESLTSPLARRTLEQLAIQVCDALGRLASRPGVDLHQIEKSSPKTSETLVVDYLHRGESFASISAAILLAPPGARILVHPGLYDESLMMIDKPLDIIGVGNPDEIVIRVEAEAIVFAANAGRIANLTVQADSRAVIAGQGRLLLEGCDITSRDTCVTILDGANPRLTKNRIHGGDTGVRVLRGARGTLEENDIFENKADVMVEGNPTITHNKIHDSVIGLSIHDDGLGTFEHNDIFAIETGVFILSGGNPALRYNRIYNSTDFGVKVIEKAIIWYLTLTHKSPILASTSRRPDHETHDDACSDDPAVLDRRGVQAILAGTAMASWCALPSLQQ